MEAKLTKADRDSCALVFISLILSFIHSKLLFVSFPAVTSTELQSSYNVACLFPPRSLIGGSDYKLIYRHYATLYFVFCVDSSESELGILDLIQVSLFSI